MTAPAGGNKVSLQFDPSGYSAIWPAFSVAPTVFGGTAPIRRDRHLEAIAKHGRMNWQRSSGYNRRSFAETAMYRYKTIIGRRLQARTLPNKRTEAKIDATFSIKCQALACRSPSGSSDAVESAWRHCRRSVRAPNPLLAPSTSGPPMTVEITYRYTAQPGAVRAVPDRPDDAVQRLNAGNRSFSELVKQARHGSRAVRSTVEFDSRLIGLDENGRRIAPQEPFAAVLGCADARVPIELVFNEGPNELFVVRVAGNSLGTDVLGSFHYAISHLRKSLRLLVVLGHSGCGALTAAVDAFPRSGRLPGDCHKRTAS